MADYIKKAKCIEHKASKNEFVVNSDMFGQYVRIPTGYSRELHIYKVVSCFQSNGYCDVPIVFGSEPILHDKLEYVLNVIHCGVDESKVIRVALSDCEFIKEKTVPNVAHEPVIHGSWSWCSGTKYRCTNCGRHTNVDEVADEPVYNFCPYCGADMREE